MSSTAVPKVMLDSNILFDFAKIEYKKWSLREPDKILVKSAYIYLLLGEKKFHCCLSKFGFWELRDILHKMRLERRLLKEGYSIDQFNEAKKYVHLSQYDMNIVNNAIREISNNVIIETKAINENFVEKLTKRGISFMDAVLIDQAEQSQCKYFVTRDEKLRLALERNKFLLNTTVETRNGFISKIKHNKESYEFILAILKPE